MYTYSHLYSSVQYVTGLVDFIMFRPCPVRTAVINEIQR